MTETNIRIVQRTKDLWQRLQAPDINWTRLLIYFVGWLVSFLILSPPSDISFPFNFAILVANVFVWFRLLGEVVKQRIPNELLLLAFFLSFLLEALFLHAAYGAGLGDLAAANLLLHLPQTILLAFAFLFFTILLAQCCDNRKSVLIWFGLLAWLCIGMLKSDVRAFTLIVQIILFIFALRRVPWLEELTKAECWLYLVLTFLLFRWLGAANPFEDLDGEDFQHLTLWLAAPKFLYFLLKMYLLAVLVKIPVVLVYNFASLPRKMRISTLFQSTFPQFFQLGMLLIIFYFFVVGLQAEKLRKAVYRASHQVTTNGVNGSFDTISIDMSNWLSTLEAPGYEPISLPAYMPERGIIALNSRTDAGKRDFFFFTVEDTSDRLLLVKMDSEFLSEVAEHVSILAGTHLAAYPYTPYNWESKIYNFSIGDLTFWGEPGNLQIFPFGLTSQKREAAITTALQDTTGLAGWQEELNQELRGHNQFSAGRVVASVIGAQNDAQLFYAFDILILPDFSFFTKTLLSFILFLFLVFIMVNLVITRRMVRFGSDINRNIIKRFNQLRSGIGEIAGGNLDYKVMIEGRDEFVELAERFNQMGDRLKESIAEAREKERLQHELTIARKVQLDLLPRELPSVPGFEIAAALETANEVGGDFYDVIKLDDNRYLFTVGDVSGKGTSAAFYMAQCISLIRYSHQFTDSPREIAARLNRYFSDPLIDAQIFVTAIIGILDISTDSVRYVRAGHTLPIFLPGDPEKQAREIEHTGIGIGIEKGGSMFEQVLEEGKLELSPGDALVLYTDGVEEAARTVQHSDQPGADDTEFYSLERMRNKLCEVRAQRPSRMLAALQQDISSFYGENPRVDDYTVLIVRKM